MFEYFIDNIINVNLKIMEKVISKQTYFGRVKKIRKNNFFHSFIFIILDMQNTYLRTLKCV